MKILIRRITAIACTALVLVGAVATTALANSTQVLQDVELATLQAGEAPAISSLPANKKGGWVTTQTPGGIALAVPAGAITNIAEGTIVKGEGQSDIVFQNVGGGSYRASIHINSPSDPERYEFNVKGASRLLKQFDGSVQAFNDEGELVTEIETPWAKDANGKDVPTHYEIDGDRLTLIQVIEHRVGGYVYAIVADPSWGVKVGHTWVHFNRKESKYIARRAKEGGGAAAGAAVGGGIGAAGSLPGIIAGAAIGAASGGAIAEAVAPLTKGKCLSVKILHPIPLPPPVGRPPLFGGAKLRGCR